MIYANKDVAAGYRFFMKILKTSDIILLKLANPYSLLIYVVSSLKNVLKGSKTGYDVICV